MIEGCYDVVADCRMQRSLMPPSTQSYSLARSHPLTALIVQDSHLRVCHNGVKETLMELQRRFWVLSGQSLPRAMVHKCTVCRRFEGEPFKAHRHLRYLISGSRKTQPSVTQEWISLDPCLSVLPTLQVAPRCGSASLLAWSLELFI